MPWACRRCAFRAYGCGRPEQEHQFSSYVSTFGTRRCMASSGFPTAASMMGTRAGNVCVRASLLPCRDRHEGLARTRFRNDFGTPYTTSARAEPVTCRIHFDSMTETLMRRGGRPRTSHARAEPTLISKEGWYACTLARTSHVMRTPGEQRALCPPMCVP